MARTRKKKRRGGGKSIIRSVEKLMSVAAFFAPETHALVGGFSRENVGLALSYKTGYNFASGNWIPSRLVIGWGPFIAFTVVSKLAHKLTSIIRKL